MMSTTATFVFTQDMRQRENKESESVDRYIKSQADDNTQPMTQHEIKGNLMLLTLLVIMMFGLLLWVIVAKIKEEYQLYWKASDKTLNKK